MVAALRPGFSKSRGQAQRLDVALNEDDCRIRKDYAPENFAVMLGSAVNLLGREKSNKRGVKNKQFLAAMDNKYLTKVLAAA